MSWLTIRNFGRVKYFNISYIVLIGVPAITEIYNSIHKYADNIVLPLNLKILFASSICYAFAITIYQYCCPRIIKLYETELEYINAAYHFYLRAHPDRKIEIVLANLIESQNDIKNRIIKLKGDQTNPNDARYTELDELIQFVYPSCIQRYLVNEFHRAQKIYPVMCWMSGILYIVGTILLLYLLIIKGKLVFTA